MTIGERIKTARKSRGLTQKELAQKIDKGYSTLQKYEIDVVTPTIDVISRIAQALKVDMTELLPIDKAETKTEDKPAHSIGIDEAIQLTNDMHTIRKLISGYDGIFQDGGAQTLELALLTEILSTLKDIKKDLTPAGKQRCKGHKPTELSAP